MRILIFGLLATAISCVAGEAPLSDKHPLLPVVLTREMIEKKPPALPCEKVKFNGRDYLVALLGLGDGVPYTQIGIYAPQEDGTFRLSLFAESWAAGCLKPTLDAKTGILELKESANSELKGKVILSCNLRSIGTQSSTRMK